MTTTNQMKILFKLANLALLTALVSCGKSREEELNAVNAAKKDLFNAVYLSEATIRHADDKEGVKAMIEILVSPDFFKKLSIEGIEPIEGIDNKQIINLKGWFDASLRHSGELIKKSKPTNNDLKEAHKKLSDLHTKFEVVLSEVHNPSGTLIDYNAGVSKFQKELLEFNSWWKREMNN